MNQKINIKGSIVSDSDAEVYRWLGYEVTSPKDIVLPTNGSDVVVEINSPGGDVFSGAEIYTALRSYEGKVTVNIVGVAASAASFVAMAGDEIQISPLGQMMIHNVASAAAGDADEHEHLAGILRDTSTQLASSYAARSGRSEKEFIDLMNKETWFTAQAAVEAGLADKIMFAEDEAVQLVASEVGTLPKAALDKARALINQEDQQELEAKDPKSLSDIKLKIDVDDKKYKQVIADLQNQVNELKESQNPKPRFLF